MSKMSDLAMRCELALMGKVQECSNNEAQMVFNYIKSACGYEDSYNDIDILKDRIQKYNENNIKYVVTNRVLGMPCISFLLADDSAEYPKPFEEDYGTGFPCAFTYTFNFEGDSQCSEFGDSFFEKRKDGFYHRVS